MPTKDAIALGAAGASGAVSQDLTKPGKVVASNRNKPLELVTQDEYDREQQYQRDLAAGTKAAAPRRGRKSDFAYAVDFAKKAASGVNYVKKSAEKLMNEEVEQTVESKVFPWRR